MAVRFSPVRTNSRIGLHDESLPLASPIINRAGLDDPPDIDTSYSQGGFRGTPEIEVAEPSLSIDVMNMIDNQMNRWESTTVGETPSRARSVSFTTPSAMRKPVRTPSPGNDDNHPHRRFQQPSGGVPIATPPIRTPTSTATSTVPTSTPHNSQQRHQAILAAAAAAAVTPYNAKDSTVFAPIGITETLFHRSPDEIDARNPPVSHRDQFYCNRCRCVVTDGDNFCRKCGTPVAPLQPSRQNMEMPQSHRSSRSRSRTPETFMRSGTGGDQNTRIIAKDKPGVSLLELEMEYEKTNPRLTRKVEGVHGAVLELPDDDVPVVPEASISLRTTTWSRHPAATVVLSLLALRGVFYAKNPELIDRHMTRPFLDALARMMSGAYFMRYSKQGSTHERWFVLAMLQGLDKTLGALPYFCWAGHAHSHNYRERLCLSELVGVQRDSFAPGFQPYLINADFIYAPTSTNRKHPVSAKSCFTLWFLSAKGVHSVNLLHHDEGVYHTWVHALEVIRSINRPGDRNYSENAYKRPVVRAQNKSAVPEATDQKPVPIPAGGRATHGRYV